MGSRFSRFGRTTKNGRKVEPPKRAEAGYEGDHTLGDLPGGAASAPEEEAAGLATTRLDGISPQPVRYLLEGYVPEGKLTLLAGDGGHGKTMLTLELAAGVSTG